MLPWSQVRDLLDLFISLPRPSPLPPRTLSLPQVGDLLLELHGRKVNSYESLTEALSSAKGASAVIAKVRRKSGGEEILTLAPANGNHAGRPVIRGAKGAV